MPAFSPSYKAKLELSDWDLISGYNVLGGLYMTAMHMTIVTFCISYRGYAMVGC